MVSLPDSAISNLNASPRKEGAPISLVPIMNKRHTQTREMLAVRDCNPEAPKQKVSLNLDDPIATYIFRKYVQCGKLLEASEKYEKIAQEYLSKDENWDWNKARPYMLSSLAMIDLHTASLFMKQREYELAAKCFADCIKKLAYGADEDLAGLAATDLVNYHEGKYVRLEDFLKNSKVVKAISAKRC